MKKVLIIAYYFPPIGGGGVQRTLKFAKYLPEFCWQPVILTGKSAHSGSLDAHLLGELSSDIKIYRTPAMLLPAWLPWRIRNFITRWFLFVDDQLGWFPYAAKRGIQIFREENIQAIFSTSTPYTDHLIGYHLKRKFDLPWIADFRDPWIGNFSSTFPTQFHENIAAQIEGKIIQTADKTIVVSEPIRQSLLARNKNITEDRIITIPNGYDSMDFKQEIPAKKHTDKFNIVYTGSFYSHKQMPYQFLQSLRSAIDKGSIPKTDIEVRFIGSIHPGVAEHIRSLNLSQIVKLIDYQPHDQIIDQLLMADALLLIIGSGSGSEAVFTGKIFEYLFANKPILALVPPGVAADLILAAQAGIIVDPDDIQSIAEQIVDFYGKWKKGTLTIDSRYEIISQFDRLQLTKKLAMALDAVTSERRHP